MNNLARCSFVPAPFPSDVAVFPCMHPRTVLRPPLSRADTTLADSNLAVDRARPHYERAADAAEDTDALGRLAAEYGGTLLDWGRKVSNSHDKVGTNTCVTQGFPYSWP